MTDIPEQLPPQDLHAEQATLGGMLVEPGAATRVLAAVNAEDFYRQVHREIFRTIATIVEREEPVDLVTVSGELRRIGKLDAIGSPAYLTALIRETPTAAHVVRYAKIVGEKAALRNLITAGAELQRLGYSNPPEVEDTLHEGEMSVARVRKRWMDQTAVRGGEMSELVPRVGGAILDKWADPPGIDGPRFGIPSIDELVGGLPIGLTVVMGQTGHGKTPLCCQLARHTAMHGDPVAYIDLEQTEEAILRKMIQQCTGIDAHWRKFRRATADQLSEGAKALDAIQRLPLRIDSPASMDYGEFRAWIMELHREFPRRLYVLDYFQELTVKGARDQFEGYRMIAPQLHGLGRELGATIAVGSQVSLTDQGRFREYGASVLGHKAGVKVILRKYVAKGVEVDSVDEEQAERISAVARISIAKHREGSTGSEPVFWCPSWQRFFDLGEAWDHVDNIEQYQSHFDPKQWQKIVSGKWSAAPEGGE